MPDHMQHKFDNPEQWAKEFDDPARDAWQLPARVIEALKLQPGQAVADIGAGTGYFSSKLAKSPAAPTVYAVDIEPAMVAHLTSRAAKEGLKNLLAVQAGPDGPNLPAPVDTVLIVDTFHHIPDRVAYFTRLRRSIKPGGSAGHRRLPQGRAVGTAGGVPLHARPDHVGAEAGRLHAGRHSTTSCRVSTCSSTAKQSADRSPSNRTMEQLWQDLRVAARGLLKDRAFSVTTVATLALCLAANIAIFAVVDGVLLKPLPFDGARPAGQHQQLVSGRWRRRRRQRRPGLFRPPRRP